MLYDDETLLKIINHPEEFEEWLECGLKLPEYFPALDKEVVFESFIAVLDPSYSGIVSKVDARENIEKFDFWLNLAAGIGNLEIHEIPIFSITGEIVDQQFSFPWGYIYATFGEENEAASWIKAHYHTDEIWSWWEGKKGTLVFTFYGKYMLGCTVKSINKYPGCWEVELIIDESAYDAAEWPHQEIPNLHYRGYDNIYIIKPSWYELEQTSSQRLYICCHQEEIMYIEKLEE